MFWRLKEFTASYLCWIAVNHSCIARCRGYWWYVSHHLHIRLLWQLDALLQWCAPPPTTSVSNTLWWIDPSHESHNDKYPTMHHFVTEMCTFLLQNCALWDMGLVHYGICVTNQFLWFTEAWWHIYALMNLVIIGSNTGLLPAQGQAITSTIGELSIKSSGTNFCDILIRTRKFSFMKMYLKNVILPSKIMS